MITHDGFGGNYDKEIVVYLNYCTNIFFLREAEERYEHSFVDLRAEIRIGEPPMCEKRRVPAK